MQCSKCGNTIKNNEKFCSKCGAQNENYLESIKQKEQQTNNINAKNKKLIIIISCIAFVVIIAIILIIALCSSDEGTSSKKKKSSQVNFEKISEELELGSYYVNVASDNSYMEIDTNPLDLEDFSSLEAYNMVKKINRKLNLPESLDNKMDNTRSMDGRLQETYDKVTVSWTYHPDKGLEVMYEKNK